MVCNSRRRKAMKKRDHENFIKEITQPAIYEYDNRRYIVTPHFNKDGKETLGELLLKMMKDDIENNRI
jgi:hypothetical protein